MLDTIHAQTLEWLAEWNCCGHRLVLAAIGPYLSKLF